MGSGAGKPLRVGVLGAGMIAVSPYGFLPNLAKIRDRVEVLAIASRSLERARQVAEQFQIPDVHADLGSMLADPRLDAIINLTPISAHFETSMRIIEARKHLVSEKPLVPTLQEATALCEAAEKRGVLIVTAPFDLLGSEWATARRLVMQGAIGRPSFARVQCSHGGPALMGWPTDPAWVYGRDAGPLLDLGVYGLHRITGMLGPARRVSAFSGITEPVRHVRGGPFDGQAIQVESPDNNLMLLDFGNSCFASVDATFNVVASRSPLVELYGNQGTLLVDYEFRGPIELFKLDAAPGIDSWLKPTPIGLPAGPDRVQLLQRAVMVEHLADCLDSGARPILSGEHARHVIEIMAAAKQSAETGMAVELTTSFSLPS